MFRLPLPDEDYDESDIDPDNAPAPDWQRMKAQAFLNVNGGTHVTTLDRLEKTLQAAIDLLAKPPTPERARLLLEHIALAAALVRQHKDELKKRGINGAGTEGFGSL